MIVAACLEARSRATTATATTGDIVAPPLHTCRWSILSVPPGGSLTALAPLHPPRSSSLKCGAEEESSLLSRTLYARFVPESTVRESMPDLE